MSKYTRPSSIVICENCSIEFSKENRLITKTIEREGVHCCSKKCSSEYVTKKAIERSNPFNHYLINIRKRSKELCTETAIVTAEYLEQIWVEQSGLCAITGIKLQHAKQRTKKVLDQASVDRIDNSKGYINGNIQFTTLGANYLRNTFTLEEVQEFLSKM